MRVRCLGSNRYNPIALAMKITFIRPSMNHKRAYDAMEPLVFSILAGLTPPDIEVVLYDERLESIPYDEPTDLVAITVETYTARSAYQTAAEFRRRGVRVVMGGYHATFMPEEVQSFCDSLVIGDAEGLWEQIISDVKKNNLKKIYRQENQPSIADLKPDRKIFMGKRYAPISLIQYGRGCRYACDFCSIHAMYGSQLRQRNVDEIVKEVKSARRKHIFFVDDNIFVDVQKAEELFKALIPLKIRWSCQVTIDITQYDHLLDLMKESGCISVLIGFESLNKENLKQMNKRWSLKQGPYSTTIQKFHNQGIMIYGTFVFGYDDDLIDSFDTALDFAIQSNFLLANFNPLTPMPGTTLYERLKIEKRLITDRWWLDPNYRYGQTIFHPRKMSARELTENCFRARNFYYSFSSIFRRLFQKKSNFHSFSKFNLFLVSNLISRKEIMNKQWASLGDHRPLEPLKGL